MHDVLLGWLTFLTGLAQAPYILQGIHPVKHQGVDIEWLAWLSTAPRGPGSSIFGWLTKTGVGVEKGALRRGSFDAKSAVVEGVLVVEVTKSPPTLVFALG
jgi:hypothetical protein